MKIVWNHLTLNDGHEMYIANIPVNLFGFVTLVVENSSQSTDLWTIKGVNECNQFSGHLFRIESSTVFKDIHYAKKELIQLFNKQIAFIKNTVDKLEYGEM